MEPQELLTVVKENTDNPLKLLLETLNFYKNDEGFTQDLLTPGFLKEWMVSKILNHECHKTKHGADATSLDGEEYYEYLSCKEGGSFQLDRIHEGNLHRITRNDKFYFALYNKNNSLECIKIYEADTDVVLEEANKKISKMSKSSNHIGFTLTWVKENCNIVYSI
jgi:hypothetical protein